MNQAFYTNTGSEGLASFGILFTLEMVQKLFVRPIRMLLDDVGDELPLLITCWVNGRFGFGWVGVQFQ